MPETAACVHAGSLAVTPDIAALLNVLLHCICNSNNAQEWTLLTRAHGGPLLLLAWCKGLEGCAGRSGGGSGGAGRRGVGRAPRSCAGRCFTAALRLACGPRLTAISLMICTCRGLLTDQPDRVLSCQQVEGAVRLELQLICCHNMEVFMACICRQR